MVKKSLRQRQRPLRIEPLESRRLLTGSDCGIEPLAEFAAVSLPLQSVTSVVSATDAGSTRDTAANLGSLDGTVQLSGSLSRTDLIDAIQFSVSANADFSVRLSNLNRNADLYLFDVDGKQIASSALMGRSVDSITGSLVAGTYFVSVVNATLSSTNYRLSLSANLRRELPPATPSTPPTTTQPDATSPSNTPLSNTQPASTTPANTTPVSNPPSTSVAPLADVAYYGGSRDWNLNAVRAPEAWAAGYTGKGVTVAIVDTGVDLNHSDLVQNLYVNPEEIAGNGVDDDGNGYVDDVHGYDFADGDASPDDLNGHGTHVAGTIAAARNGVGATGVAPDAKIIPVRVLDRNGSGSDAGVAAGIRYAAKLGADIINLSLGGVYSRAIDSAIEYARSVGSIIIAAAGNESASVPGYPARFSSTASNVISVAAYNSSSSLASFSNRVGNSGAVQVDAPGVGIYSTYMGGGYATLSGTSMATPHVAGLAALILSANSTLTSRELRDLLATGTSGRASGSDSIGMANASISVAYAAAGLKTVASSSMGQRVAGTIGSQRSITVRTKAVADPWLVTSAIDTKVELKQADFTRRIDDRRQPTVATARPQLLDITSVSRSTQLDAFFSTYDPEDLTGRAFDDYFLLTQDKIFASSSLVNPSGSVNAPE